MLTVHRNPSRREILVLGLVLLGGFGVLGLLLWRAGRMPEAGWGWAGTGRQSVALAMWAVGLILGGACLASPSIGRRIHVAWMTLGMYLGAAMTTVVLTGLFLVFLPLFSFIRLGDPLRRRRGAESYWEPHRPHEPTLERMARPF